MNLLYQLVGVLANFCPELSVFALRRTWPFEHAAIGEPCYGLLFRLPALVATRCRLAFSRAKLLIVAFKLLVFIGAIIAPVRSARFLWFVLLPTTIGSLLAS